MHAHISKTVIMFTVKTNRACMPCLQSLKPEPALFTLFIILSTRVYTVQIVPSMQPENALCKIITAKACTVQDHYNHSQHCS